MSPAAFLRRLFPLVALLASGIFWIAPHPPMVDLPQHAAQVELLRRLLEGTSPWSSVFTVNWLTPYLIGYGIALPLTSLMSVTAAMKLMLSVAYLTFVFMCTRVRRHLGSDPRLDWYFLIGFFGFVYEWGFFTFMVAAPIALGFAIAASRQVEDPSPGRGAVVAGLGALLLVSHGLMFMYALGLGLALVAGSVHPGRLRLRAVWPYLVMSVGGLALIVNGRRLDMLYPSPDATRFFWGLGWHRITDLAATGIAADLRISVPLAIALGLAPWVLGLRVEWRRRERWIPFAFTAALLLFLPFFAMKIAFLQNRFGLFLFASYAWMFTAPSGAPIARSRALVAPFVASACCMLLAVHAVKAQRFAQETAAFDAVIGQLATGKRGIGLVYEPVSSAAGNGAAYYHYPMWYQVDRGGLVEFNFAWFYVQVVRYRQDRMPKVSYPFDATDFDWTRHGGADFDYFFVRRTGGAPAGLFRDANCDLALVASAPPWFVYRRGACR